MDRDQNEMRQREQYQGDRFEESSYRQGERAMTSPSQDRQRQSGQSGMERSGSPSSDMTTSGETGGDWQGFVVPYRYYGPGYAGLGYYAVYYQGGEGQREEGDTSSRGFDQRTAQYGQGQGAGPAGQSGRAEQSGGRWQGQESQWNPQDRQSTGGYAGRGPKGYRRSDDRIREEISDQFMEHDELDASEIEVKVADGIVTLIGTVEDRRAKRLAEDMAERASGVRDVMNQLKVADQGGSRPGQSSDTYGRGGSGTPASGSTSGSGARSSSGTRSTTTTGSRSRSGKSSGTSSSGSTGSETRQPVSTGSGVGGAPDGATGNGSNRESGGQAR
jgi:osmotically-inducible protein OsmY